MKKLIYNETVYTYQIDYARHVSNIVYIEWLENGRLKLLEDMGIPVEKIAEEHNIVPILTETNIKYKRPFLLGDKVTIELWLSELRNASAIMEFRFYNDRKELCATASQKGLFMHRETMRPQRLSAELRNAFEKYLENKAVWA